MRNCIILISFIFLSLEAFGSKTHELNKAGDYINLVNKIEIYEDPQGLLQLDEALTKNYSPHKGQQINFQFSKSAFWLKFSICNKSREDIILDVGNHFIEYVDIYYSTSSEGKFKNIAIGSLGHESIISRKHLSYTKLNLVKGQSYVFFVRIQSSTPLRAPMHIRTMSNHIIHQSHIAKITWYFYGVASFLFLFALFVYFSLKQKLYLYFTLSLLFLISYQFGYDNFYPALPFWGESDFLLKKMNGTIIWSIFFYLLFASEFLNSKTIPKWANGILKTMIGISFFIGISFLIHFRFANALAYVFAPVIWVALTFLTVTLFIKGLKFVRFFALATIVLLGAVVMHVFTNLGYITSSNTIPQLAIKLGYLGQVFFFTIAIVDRYFLFQNDFTNILEEKVEERTTELENTLSSLQTRQQQLFQSEKMASIGTLSTGVAHEINTPLNSINCGISIFESYRNDSEVSEQEKSEKIDLSLEMMKEGIEKTTDIVNSLMNFSHVDESQLELTDINQLIDQTLLFIKSKTPQNLSILKYYLPKIKAQVYKDKFHQVIFNILLNAIEAISINKGTISISTSETQKDNQTYCRINIENSGSKIAESALLKIFDPFFTTKTQGQNVGLGLTIAYNYIKDHQGELSVRNSNSGVVFTILIPSSLAPS